MKRTLLTIAILATLAVLFVPNIRFQSLFEVDVIWSFRETTPTVHTVAIQDLTFIVPPGQAVKQSIRLKGGGISALVYTIRGWGFLDEQIKIDGKDLSEYRMRTSDEAGKIIIFGMGRAPSMTVEIEM